MIKGALILGTGLAVGFGAGWLHGFIVGFGFEDTVDKGTKKVANALMETERPGPTSTTNSGRVIQHPTFVPTTDYTT